MILQEDVAGDDGHGILDEDRPSADAAVSPHRASDEAVASNQWLRKIFFNTDRASSTQSHAVAEDVLGDQGFGAVSDVDRSPAVRRHVRMRHDGKAREHTPGLTFHACEVKQ